jgi:hypothetical protein
MGLARSGCSKSIAGGEVSPAVQTVRSGAVAQLLLRHDEFPFFLGDGRKCRQREAYGGDRDSCARYSTRYGDLQIGGRRRCSVRCGGVNHSAGMAKKGAPRRR